jgi:meso-butanediol dehydrogenase/(S,S)-butanediol dehydrogenase/diacetyl reductase
MGKLDNKVAIITGSTSGMGKATAELFASEGAKVMVVGRNAERGQKVVDGIKVKGGQATFVALDLLNQDSYDNLLKTTIDTYGKLDILVNNAGAAGFWPLQEHTMEDFKNIVETNLYAPFIMIKKAMPLLQKTKGNIVITASIAGLRPDAGGYAYNSSKAAAIMLMKGIAKDFAGEGIRCNALLPGLTDTPLLGVLTPELKADMASQMPMKKMGTAEDIAHGILFLVSDEAKYVTGVALPVSGGMEL